MKKTFIVAKINEVDSQGDLILPGAIKTKGKVLVTKDFDHSKPLGFVDVSENDNKLIATGEIDDSLMGLTPAIGFQIIESEEKDGVRILHNIKLHYIGFSANPNVDKSIQPLL